MMIDNWSTDHDGDIVILVIEGTEYRLTPYEARSLSSGLRWHATLAHRSAQQARQADAPISPLVDAGVGTLEQN